MVQLHLRTSHHAITCIVFDKDGTLVDLHHLWGAMVRRWLEQIIESLQVPPNCVESVYHTIGYDAKRQLVLPDKPLAVSTLARLQVVIATVLHQQGVPWHRAMDTCHAVLSDPANQLPSVDMLKPLYQQRTLTRLRNGGVKLAVLTSDDRAATEETLRLLEISHLFCAVGCADDVGIRPKPSREGIDRIATMCDVVPEQMLMVGDSLGDMATGRNAGVAATVGIGQVDRLQHSADIVLSSVDGLLSVLQI